jgi:Pyruvate/2-oxoacid:ferredoxin oxidoreductase delta subunit
MSKYQNAINYFFSGTGNTFRVTTWLAEEFKNQGIKTRIRPFEKADPLKEIIPGDKSILGLFLPTHGFTAPWVMIRFALSLPPGEGTHAFVSVTRGGTKIRNLQMPGFEGTAGYLLALILKLKGYKIRGVIGVDLPLNWTTLVPGFSEQTAISMNTHQKPKFVTFIQAILNGNKKFGIGTFVSLFLGILIIPFSVGYLLIARFFLAKLFFSTSNCNGCGICAENCPANAIEMRGSPQPIPFWTLKCESCMRCMNYCPRQSIESSHLLAIGFYYLASIPAGSLLMRWLLAQIPSLHPVNNPVINYLLQYSYMIIAFVMAYFVFHHLIKIEFFNKLFAYSTVTRYYRRYRQPDVKLKDMQ